MGILVYNGQNIEQRDTDGMVNITDMAKANNVLVGDWKARKTTDRYIEQLSLDMGIAITNILTSDKQDGTWAHYLLAIEFGRWVSPAFAIWCDRHIHRLVTTGKAELEANRQQMERQLRPAPTPKFMREVNAMLRSAGFPKEYIQRNALVVAQRNFPEALPELPLPQEMASLPTPKAFLTPTQIAEELGWKCKTSPNPDPKQVNQKLAQLGYQEKIQGVWTPTDKAIKAGLVDRKPVAIENSAKRSAVDQLLWSVDILPILQEHSEAIT
jgi:hypothetical protein